MVVFKCKICGGNLDVHDGESVAACEYCGTQQTLPTNSDDVIVNLFNRANNLRMKCEFDKACEVYEKVLETDDTQAEAHWGIVLCKYGVEYVEDTRTGERIPTCHRTQMESILSDVDYLSTLKYADSAAKIVYETEAAEINELQKKILVIVKNEKPFDVFVCYKETDDSGEKTRDSVVANDIYHELTASGMKVFYAAITLEDKLGQEYEPYIYAALTSAKVMLVVGTKQEYFNAVWVKNEWSRYLHLMKTDKGKRRTLIPCYRDMDAYDLPDEFSHLQALDMENIAFMPDLIRAIKKLAGSNQVSEAASGHASKVLPLLKRAFMFLEDGEFERADQLLEEVLNLDPENAKAYVGKLMISRKIRMESDLSQSMTLLAGNSYFDKACRFADAEYWAVLADYQYQQAVRVMQSGSFVEAANMFQALSDYKDAPKQREQCILLENQRIYDQALGLMHAGSFVEAAKLFQSIAGYTDAAKQSDSSLQYEYERIYKLGMRLMESDPQDALIEFQKIRGYRDSDEQIKQCEEWIEDDRQEAIYQNAIDYVSRARDALTPRGAAAGYHHAAQLFGSIPNYKDANTQQLRNKYLKLARNRDRASDIWKAMDEGLVAVLFTIPGSIIFCFLFWRTGFGLTDMIGSTFLRGLILGTIIWLCICIAMYVSLRLKRGDGIM